MRLSSLLLRVTCLVALLGLAACGGDDGKPAADASQADTSADAATDGGQDTGTPDTGTPDTATPDTTPVDTGTPDTTADTAPAGKPCLDVALCAANCGQPGTDGSAACLKACADQGTTEAKAEFDAYTGCVVSLCADVTETSAKAACAWDKCYGQLETCGDFGAGQAGCVPTTACLGRCTLGDAACRFACLQNGSKDAAAGAKGLLVCLQASCGQEAPGDAMAACLASKCGDVLTTCKGAGNDCTATSACLAKCPVPLPNSPNVCKPVCHLLATAEASAQSTTYQQCKDQCAKAISIPKCVAETCSKEQDACFGTAGTDTCQAIYNCVKAECDGLGGDEACVAACVAKGKGPAKDAFVNYEGCILNQLGTKEAKTAGCEFPYDEATCLNIISGFCSNQHSACFTQ